jgi:potassium-transporting ATPase KdpC subunit
MKRQIGTGVKLLIVMVIITGLIYPAIITATANLLFNKKAHGSLIVRNGMITGSELIGQRFDSRKYFRSRPSSINYNPLPSGGSNLGRLNPSFSDSILHFNHQFILDNMQDSLLAVPHEMVTSSASGLDPHISPRAALLQVNRVAVARKLDSAGREQLCRIIGDLTEKRQFSLFGEPRINVFLLNLKIDSLK